MKQTKAQDNLELKFNNFIEKWCGNYSAHLLDNDENDGEEFRVLLRKQRQAVIKECIEALPKRIAVFYKSSVIDVASKIPNKTYRGLIEMGRGEGRYLEANHNRDILEKLLETAV